MASAVRQQIRIQDVACPDGQQAVILVADDDVAIRELVTLLLQSEGYSVLACADGEESLEISRRYPGKIDVCITDHEMPGLKGTELCGHLAKERPDIKVLVMSGSEVDAVFGERERLPFLPKPFKGRTLLNAVKAMIEPTSMGSASGEAA